MRRAGAGSTHPIAGEVAAETIAGGGSALKAVLSGFFGAAGAHPGVLFGPVSLVVGGIGVGPRAFDGRCLQPGHEGKRPRGFLSDETIPLAAYAAIPGSLWATAVCCGYHTGTTLGACVRPGISISRKAGAKGRAELLERVGALGPRIFLDASVRHAWLTQFGPVEGGMVQNQDLQPRQGLDMAAAELGRELTVPWAKEEEAADVHGQDAPATDHAAGIEHGLVAVDAQAMLVAMSFRVLPGQALLGDFEVSVPLLGVPVRRGVPRMAPRSPLPTSAGVALGRAGGVYVSARAGSGVRPGIEQSSPTQAQVYRNPSTREVVEIGQGIP